MSLVEREFVTHPQHLYSPWVYFVSFFCRTCYCCPSRYDCWLNLLVSSTVSYLLIDNHIFRKGNRWSCLTYIEIGYDPMYWSLSDDDKTFASRAGFHMKLWVAYGWPILHIVKCAWSSRSSRWRERNTPLQWLELVIALLVGLIIITLSTCSLYTGRQSHIFLFL